MLTDRQRKTFLDFLNLPIKDGEFIIDKNKTDYLLTNDKLKVSIFDGSCRSIDKQFIDKFVMDKLTNRIEEYHRLAYAD